MLARRARKRAPLGGALFAFWLLVGVAQACDLATPDDRVRVRHVHDGDSLVLEDGRRLRVMGINAPELGRDGAADEPFAIAARDALRRELFRSGQVVGLRYGVERQDHYGRTLAHIFGADGENLGAALLRQGLVMAIVIPPDLWGLDCYPDAEREAREAGRGLWAHPDFQPRESRSLGLRDEGFMLVRGRVERIGRSRDARWINLEGRVALRVPEESLGYFETPLESLVGQRIEARGWFHLQRNELRATLHHPAALQRLDPPPRDAEPRTP
ncbi:MAG: thermonuclease family protein [Gammaproteobacteria bacterium]|nr:thermonuclease family protein [Gammaproteobacteria bacterium]